MLRPTFQVKQNQNPANGNIFGAPINLAGWSSFPLIPIALIFAFAHTSHRRHPNRKPVANLSFGFLAMNVFLGSEWAHNFAHLYAAQQSGAPADGIRFVLGTPLLVYNDVNDAAVSPLQHIRRTAAGPVFSAAQALIGVLLRHLVPPKSWLREIIDIYTTINTVIASAGLAPFPALDGGPLIKWSLVHRGVSNAKADLIVRKINAGTAPLFASIAAWAIHRKHSLLSGLMSLFTVLAVGYASGVLAEPLPAAKD